MGYFLKEPRTQFIFSTSSGPEIGPPAHKESNLKNICRDMILVILSFSTREKQLIFENVFLAGAFQKYQKTFACFDDLFILLSYRVEQSLVAIKKCSKIYHRASMTGALAVVAQFEYYVCIKLSKHNSTMSSFE